MLKLLLHHLLLFGMMAPEDLLAFTFDLVGGVNVLIGFGEIENNKNN